MIDIDKNTIYQSHEYKFKNFVLLSEKEMHFIWQWRNAESIRKWMYNTEIIPWEIHLNFIKLLKEHTNNYYWLIYKTNSPIGILDLTNYNVDADKAEIGYYANPNVLGIGFEMLRECFYFCFNIICITSISLTVKKENRRAVLLNQFLGMKYTSCVNINIFGKLVSFYICGDFTKSDFDGKYNLSRADYKEYLSKKI